MLGVALPMNQMSFQASRGAIGGRLDQEQWGNNLPLRACPPLLIEQRSHRGDLIFRVLLAVVLLELI
jgi:hypothetical protein